MANGVLPLAGEAYEGETHKAILALNDYLRLGPGRSMQKLLDRYHTNAETSPTKRLATLKDWSIDYGWQERAVAYDAQIESQKDDHRRAIMEAGLALDYERVQELSEIYGKLKVEFILKGLWYTDTKLSSTGMSVDVQVFNKALIDSMRGTLDDIAKETSGRKQQAEVGGIGGRPIKTETTITHAIDGDTAETIFGILAAAGAFPSASSDAETE